MVNCLEYLEGNTFVDKLIISYSSLIFSLRSAWLSIFFSQTHFVAWKSLRVCKYNDCIVRYENIYACLDTS